MFLTTLKQVKTSMADEQVIKKYAAELAVEVTTAYLANTQVNVKPDEVEPLFKRLADSISNYVDETDTDDNTESTDNNDQVTPKVAVEDSINYDYLVCLECGKHLNMLKRHLERDHHLKDYEYRDKYHLPSNYPMVCQKYSEKRSEIAKKSHFGDVRKEKRGK